MNKTGVAEWAEHSANCLIGCSHNCRYCFGREMAVRFGRCKAEDWARPRVNPKAMAKKWPKLDGVVMAPTTHDILPEFLPECTRFLLNILEAGNRVLIVSKPHLECVEHLTRVLKPHIECIEFRFTIGSFSPQKLAYWESGAPDGEERIAAFAHARDKDFETSISMEPMLTNVDAIVASARWLVANDASAVWIGKMNRVRSRVRIETEKDEEMVRLIEEQQRDDEILRLVHALSDEPRVRWKDSIQAVIDRKGGQHAPEANAEGA